MPKESVAKTILYYKIILNTYLIRMQLRLVCISEMGCSLLLYSLYVCQYYMSVNRDVRHGFFMQH